MIKGLDDDEIEFLDLVDRTKLAADRKKEIEEELELNDYRNRVAILQEKSIEERMHNDIIMSKVKTINSNRNSQKQLKGVVIKKTEKRKISESSEEENTPKKNANNEVKSNITLNKSDSSTALKCVAVLPGLGCYDDSSTDENSSSDSEVDKRTICKTDLLGRKIEIKPKDG